MGLARPDYGNNERDERRNDGGLRCSLHFYFAFHVLLAVLLALSHIYYIRDLSFLDFRCPLSILRSVVNSVS